MWQSRWSLHLAAECVIDIAARERDVFAEHCDGFKQLSIEAPTITPGFFPSVIPLEPAGILNIPH